MSRFLARLAPPLAMAAMLVLAWSWIVHVLVSGLVRAVQ